MSDLLIAITMIVLIFLFFLSVGLALAFLALFRKLNSLEHSLNRFPAEAVHTKPVAPPEPKPLTQILPQPDARETDEHAIPQTRQDPILQFFSHAWSWFCVGERYRTVGVAAEYQVAITWLLRGAILTLLSAVGYFLHYSYTRNLIIPEVRVALTVATGVALITGGAKLLCERYHKVAVALTGTGFASLYFAVFSALSLYHLCSGVTAFLLSAFVTAAAVLLSVKLNVVTIALVGLVGGYLSPLLFSSGQRNLIGLGIYLLLLSGGVLVAARFRSWKALQIPAFWFHWGLLGGAVSLSCAAEYPAAIILVGATFVLFCLLPVLYNWSHRIPASVPDILQVFLNSIVAVGLGTSLTADLFSMRMAAAVPGVAALFFVLLIQLGLRRARSDQRLLLSWFTIGVFSIAIALVLLLDGSYITFGWTALATALFWLAKRVDNSVIRGVGMVVFVAAAVRIFGMDLDHFQWHGSWLSGVLPRLLSLGTWSAAAFVILRWLPGRNKFRGFFAAAGVLGVLLFLSMETRLFFGTYLPQARPGALSVTWGIYALGCLVVGLLTRRKPLRIFGLVLFGLTMLKVFFFDLAGFDSIYRVAALAVIGGALLCGAFLYIRFRDRVAALNSEKENEIK